MGSKSSKEEKTEILNQTSVKNALSNINENVTEITMDIMQKNTQQTSSGAAVDQSQEMGDIIAAGDGASITGSQKMSAAVKIDVKALQETKMQNDIAQDMMNQLQTKLEEQMKMTQEQAQQNGEQMMSELMGTLSSMVPGGQSSSKNDTSIKNILDIESEVELKNIVKQAVNIDMVTESVQSIATQLDVVQKQKVGKLAALGDDSSIDFSQEMSVDLQNLTDAVTRSGITSQMVSAVTNTSEADVQKSLEAGQKASQENQGTLGGIADVVGTAFEGASGLMSATLGGMSMPFIIVGGIVVLVLIYFLFFRGSSQPAPPQYQYGGGLKSITKSIFKPIQKFIKDILKYIKKKKLTNVIISGIIIFIIYRAYKEDFKFSKLTDRTITRNGKSVISEKLCFGDKAKALKFTINNVTDDKIYLKLGEKVLRIDDSGIKFEKYNLDNDLKYQIKHEKVGYKFRLSRNDQYVGIKNNCLALTKNKKEAALLEID